MKSEERKWCYSADGEDWRGEFDTREEALEELKTHWEGYAFGEIAQTHKPSVALHINGEDFCIRMAEDNEEHYCIEGIEEWPRATVDQYTDLENMLQATFEAWLTKHDQWPSHWVVDNETVIDARKIEEKEIANEANQDSNQKEAKPVAG